MKKIFALVAALVIFIVIANSILFDDSNKCHASGGPIGTSVPSGSFAQPEAMPPARLTSTFGERWGDFHYGIDLATEPKTPIYAFADGLVVAAGPASGFGNWIVIEHDIEGEKITTVYGHIFDEDILVKTGQQVRAGQQIAAEGWNGDVVPKGPGGSHLHFEIRKGDVSGTAMDPQPWLDKAVNPTESDPETIIDAREAVLEAGEPLPPLPSAFGSEAHHQRDAIKLKRAVHLAFPEIKIMGGWRPYDPYPDHPSGRAVDIMIPDYESSQGQELGTQVKDWLWANRDELNITYMIWQQTYIPSQGQGNLMEDRGSPTQNHFDHVHVTTEGGGYPSGDETYIMETINAGGSTGYSTSMGCALNVDLVEDHLHDGNIPADIAPWLSLAGRQCRGIDAPLLAAQMKAESGFIKQRVSPAGALGLAQFMPGTWATWGAKVDENGNVIGPPGSGDPNDPADAAMAQARFMCQLKTDMEKLAASGRVNGDITELTLAAYNAGPGNVESYGGVPPFAETQGYITKILQTREEFVEESQ